MRCPACLADNAPSVHACINCGRPFGVAVAPMTPGTDGPEGADRTLKTVTLLFADVVGSTAMIAQQSPERAMALYQKARAAMGRAITAAGGTLLSFTGDGVFAVFGAPIAQPDHAPRACRAGTDILSEMKRAFEDEKTPPPRVRVGVNSAEVAVTVARKDAMVECYVYGEGVNLTKRVEAAAKPDSVFCTESTVQRVQGHWEAVREGNFTLAGFQAPVALYRVVGLRATHDEK